jgi:hypothetical protein
MVSTTTELKARIIYADACQANMALKAIEADAKGEYDEYNRLMNLVEALHWRLASINGYEILEDTLTTITPVKIFSVTINTITIPLIGTLYGVVMTFEKPHGFTTDELPDLVFQNIEASGISLPAWVASYTVTSPTQLSSAVTPLVITGTYNEGSVSAYISTDVTEDETPPCLDIDNLNTIIDWIDRTCGTECSGCSSVMEDNVPNILTM